MIHMCREPIHMKLHQLYRNSELQKRTRFFIFRNSDFSTKKFILIPFLAADTELALFEVIQVRDDQLLSVTNARFNDPSHNKAWRFIW